MDFFPNQLTQYIENYSTTEDAVLQALSRETYLKCQLPQMVSGHQQGLLLTLICRLFKPEKVLEIGTFTGYSAIAMAKGMPINSLLYTIDINDELAEMVNKYFKLANVSDKIKYLTGDATLIVPTLSEQFDLVFIDADKANYCKYYDMVFDKLKPGGVIIADNVLWSGKVAEPNQQDKDTNALREFNEKIKSDKRVTHLLLSVRDGLMLIIKNH